MSDTEKLLALADMCSELIFSDECAWEDMDFDFFKSRVRYYICSGRRFCDKTERLADQLLVND